jgi:DNA-binding response OmpR family regulator
MARSLRVLIVEDEMMIALLIEDMLADLGHQAAALAMRLPAALEQAKSAEIDFAILDVNLDGQSSFPVADVLSARGVPFVFATGYGSAGVPGDYAACKVIKKPFEIDELKRAIESAVG